MIQKYFIALFIAAFPFFCMAGGRNYTDIQTDSTLHDGKVIFVDGRPVDAAEAARQVDSLRRVMSVFYYNQFRHSQEPGMPYFMFMSKDATLTMGLGGVVRMRGWFDWDGAIMSPAFAPYLIPVQSRPGHMRDIGTTPAGTSLYFRVIGANRKMGNYQLYIQADFSGYHSRDFKLKKAYAIVQDFTVGYASSTFSDPAALPPTVDSRGPNNKLSSTNVLIRWMPTFRKHWAVGVSVETPEQSVAVDEKLTATANSWVPDFAALVQYQWGEHGSEHVRLAGIVRTLTYTDLVAAKALNVAGWGLLLSSVAHPHPQFTTYANLCYGNGYASLCGDLALGNYDLVGNPDAPGRMYAPALFGGALGVQYNIRPNLFVSATGSLSRYRPAHEVSPDEYKSGIYGAANLFWNPSPRVQVGVEFNIARRNDFSGMHRTAKRLGAMCQFTF